MFEVLVEVVELARGHLLELAAQVHLGAHVDRDRGNMSKYIHIVQKYSKIVYLNKLFIISGVIWVSLRSTHQLMRPILRRFISYKIDLCTYILRLLKTVCTTTSSSLQK